VVPVIDQHGRHFSLRAIGLSLSLLTIRHSSRRDALHFFCSAA
jgi:hypothetical protein